MSGQQIAVLQIDVSAALGELQQNAKAACLAASPDHPTSCIRLLLGLDELRGTMTLQEASLSDGDSLTVVQLSQPEVRTLESPQQWDANTELTPHEIAMITTV